MTYSPGQVSVIYRYLGSRSPEWFIIGGPADGDEATCMKERYPRIKILGIEPHPDLFREGVERFPGALLNLSLGEKCGKQKLWLAGESGRSSTTTRKVRDLSSVEVGMVTLDFLSDTYGPFSDAVLWLDIEGSEWRALLGAARLLIEDRIRLINVEVMPDELPIETRKIDYLLRRLGFIYVNHWNPQFGPGGTSHYDKIYLHY